MSMMQGRIVPVAGRVFVTAALLCAGLVAGSAHAEPQDARTIAKRANIALGLLASEIVEPQRNLPRALLVGTLVVTAIYLGLNAMYLYGADVDELAGKVEVGLVAARHLFGEWGAGVVTIVVLLSLLSSASAITSMLAGWPLKEAFKPRPLKPRWSYCSSPLMFSKVK